MTTSDRVMNGTATDEEVAAALGWCRLLEISTGWGWYRHKNSNKPEPLPAFTTDIRATMAEIERRGWVMQLAGPMPDNGLWSAAVHDPEIEYQHVRPTAALLAALLRAVEGGNG